MSAEKPHFELLTLFPRMVELPLRESILGKAWERGHISIGVADIRDHATDKHSKCDDAPYGGGAGMVMKPEPLVGAIEAARERVPGAKVLLMSPRGPRFNQAMARQLALSPRLILVCGRYEGVDERVMPFLDGELSIGDFVLTGGEFAALVVVDAVARLLPGVLGNESSAGAESFEEGLLEYPQYTRPPEFRGQKVPDVLLSGNHAEVARWRRTKSLATTRERRPDLFHHLELSDVDRRLLETHDKQGK
ncbi:MAG: tRNA (guanosine(37)-N1)-methyltransferase TrmD [Deltaproteobacteria bacterium]|nr:tRNA (guanosine(37)-N1)-methyltransferase TrmD [Deltaproteobacteria bacterium]